MATQEEHNERLQKVLVRLQGDKVTLHKGKCQFSQGQIRFFGQIVDASDIRPDPENVSAIQKVPTPGSVADVQCFLGSQSQLSIFSTNFVENKKPLHELLVKGNQWIWKQPQEEGFCEVKETLTFNPVLALFDPN